MYVYVYLYVYVDPKYYVINRISTTTTTQRLHSIASLQSLIRMSWSQGQGRSEGNEMKTSSSSLEAKTHLFNAI